MSTLQYGENAFSDIDPAAPYEIGEHILTSVTAYPDFKPEMDDAEELNRQADGLDSIRVSFDRDGLLAGIRDASGAAADFGYTLDRGDGTTVETVADDGGFTTEVLRDGEGNTLRTVQQLEEADEAGSVKYLVTAFTYDADGNRTATFQPFEVTEDPAAPGSGTRFEAASPVTLSSSTFDRFGRVLSSTDAYDQTTTYAYDSRGNLTRVTDPAGKVTTSVYDRNNRLTRSVDASGNATGYAYDSNGNLSRLTQFDENGREIAAGTFQYDAKGRLVETTGIDPDGTGIQEGVTRRFAYNIYGDQVQSWFRGRAEPGHPEGRIQLTSTEHDFEGRVTRSSFSLGGSVVAVDKQAVVSGAEEVWSTSTTYDGQGRVAVSTDRFGTRTATFYDTRGNVVQTRTETKDEDNNPVYVTTATAYDRNGRAIASADPYLLAADGSLLTPVEDLRVTHTIHDAAGRVVETRRVAGERIRVTPPTWTTTPPPSRPRPTPASAAPASTPRTTPPPSSRRA